MSLTDAIDRSLPGGLIILGFGGHARSVFDVAFSAGIEKFLFVDANASSNERFLGFQVVSKWNGQVPEGWKIFCAVGDNQRRQDQMLNLLENKVPLATLIAPTSTIGPGASISAGCLIAHHAHVGPMVRLGHGCIINTGAIVEHECDVGPYSHISVRAVVAGRSKIGSRVFLGAGCTVVDSISIADNSIIGAGSVVVRTVGEPGVYVGVPAVKRRPKGRTM